MDAEETIIKASVTECLLNTSTYMSLRSSQNSALGMVSPIL